MYVGSDSSPMRTFTSDAAQGIVSLFVYPHAASLNPCILLLQWCCFTSSGTIVVWDVKKRWPLCQLALPSTTVVSGSVQCCGLTGEHALVIGYCSLEGKVTNYQPSFRRAN